MHRLLSGLPKIVLRDPCSHFEMTALMRESDLILSDSGGVQEEAPTLGVPLLVLRDRTERPEGILSGNALLVGRNPDRILETVDRLRSEPAALEAMRRPAFPYGDGRAAERVATAVEEWLMLDKRVGAAGPVYSPRSSSLAPVVARQL